MVNKFTANINYLSRGLVLDYPLDRDCADSRRGRHNMQVFKRLSAALKAAGDGPYLRIGTGNDKLYIVGIESHTGIELVSEVKPPKGSQTTGSRLISGQVLLGHLDRLGNANSAAAARLNREPTFRQAGLSQNFMREADREDYETMCQAEKAKQAEIA
jgi:hypothetical protein